MIFILDNFDSFTYNLYQYFSEIGETVVVQRRDACTLADIEKLAPELIVISPGPCTPSEAGLALDAIQTFQGRIPILGVCLGHQAIGQVLGGKVIRARTPVHGKTSLIRHDGQGVFRGLPNPLRVTRYHSLALERESLPTELEITAESEDGEIMGIRHRNLPLEGVQFHPEAILTEAGHELLRNAVENARRWQETHQTTPWQIRPFASSLRPQQLLEAFRGMTLPFFLDSGQNYPGLGEFSFLGAFPFLQATAHKDRLELYWPESGEKKILPLGELGGLSVLDELWAKYRLPSGTAYPFSGGAVGFFSYDLNGVLEKLPQNAEDDLELPYWRFAWYDGILAYDHDQGTWALIACGMREDGECSPVQAQRRLERLEILLTDFRTGSRRSPDSPTEDPLPGSLPGALPGALPAPVIHPELSRRHYLFDLEKVIAYIYAGDIYQTNLTQRFSMLWDGDPWSLYQRLHIQNPAPFAAFLPYEDFQVLCSSPERFIRIQNGKIETRPIKGTRPRGKTDSEDKALAEELWQSPKDRAELTMIIDLERNDLGRLARFGSVKVPDLIHLEKYPTVWHLVSNVTADLPETLSPSTVIKAIFPGGSITGAPKIRAMEIIEELEPFKRGLYTGSIGYFGFDGSWDLNIVIRTILLKSGIAYVHAGGGIVADSDPEDEYMETLAKGAALFRALGASFNLKEKIEEE